jgi:DNA invertase Pin-like site-specific DNA recombinase
MARASSSSVSLNSGAYVSLVALRAAPVFAEFERSMIQERVRAGLARARSEGKRLGRPSLPQETQDAIRAALSQPGRPGVRVIAKQFGVDPSTVQKISAALA